MSLGVKELNLPMYNFITVQMTCRLDYLELARSLVFATVCSY